MTRPCPGWIKKAGEIVATAATVLAAIWGFAYATGASEAKLEARIQAAERHALDEGDHFGRSERDRLKALETQMADVHGWVETLVKREMDN